MIKNIIILILIIGLIYTNTNTNTKQEFINNINFLISTGASSDIIDCYSNHLDNIEQDQIDTETVIHRCSQVIDK